MATGDVPSLDLSLNIGDLRSTSQLKSLLEQQAMPAFKFAAAAAQYWDVPVEKCPPKLSFTLSQNGSWKTSTGISFGLSGSAACALEIVGSGCVIEYLDNLDITSRTGLPSGAYDGSVYVKLSLSFDISGNVSGAGNVGALGISGNAKGSASASLVFAHRSKCGTVLRDAVSEALNNFVFPFQPNCALQMTPGDLAEVTFRGCMAYGLQLSYGLGSYNFSAPSVQTVLDSCLKGVASLNLPQATVDIGADFTVGLNHSDDFTAIVQKLDADNAFLYLMRARKTDTSVGAGIEAQVTMTGMPAIVVDQSKLEAGVNHVTHGLGGAQIAALSGKLSDKLNDKVSGWLNNVVQGGAGLKAAWDAQSSATLISKYKVALNNAAALDHSWDYFCQGNIRSAVGAGGLLLQPGSGVCENLNRTLTLKVTFFNFFHAEDVTRYFQKSEAVVTPTGNVRFLFDVGEESDSTVNKVLQKTQVHFVAEAESHQPADVELKIEMSESDNANEAAHMAAIPRYLSGNQQAAAASSDMEEFVNTHPKNTLDLNFVSNSSVYGKLTCSPHNGNKPPADQSADARNWQAFHDATMSLLNLDYVAKLTYADWQAFNKASTGGSVADRRHCGDPATGQSIWEGMPSDMRTKLGYFCLASADFMNMCDDLQHLAGIVSAAKIPDDWNRLLEDLTGIVTHDVNVDFVKPGVAAILKLCGAPTVSYEKEPCGDTLSCTLSLT